MIIATAGHVDHGKTALIKALTGQHTDRTAEERRRGMSIELGYAFLAGESGHNIDFVDVPGHEKFMRTLLAGVACVDALMLVVAADDGVMPQTLEHLALAGLLGVQQMVVVISKSSLASIEQLQALELDLIARVQQAGCPPPKCFAVDSLAGTGIDVLRAQLQQWACQAEQPDASGPARMTIDRHFSQPGLGSIVTGTLLSGRITTGDSLQLSDTGTSLRIRGIQIHRQAAQQALAGQRCAINLSGDLAGASIGRGSQLLASDTRSLTNRFDASLQLTGDNPRGPVQLHIGGAVVNARLVPLKGLMAAAGESYGQWILEQPLCCFQSDRFIIRDPAARRLLGSGRVVDPFAPSRGRQKPERLAVLRAMDHGEPVRALDQLLDALPDGVDLQRFMLARRMDRLPQLPEDTCQVGHWLCRRSSLELLSQSAVAAVGQHHQSHPDRRGPSRPQLTRQLGLTPDSRMLAVAVRGCLDAGLLQQTGACLHLPAHEAKPDAQTVAFLDRVKAHFAACSPRPPVIGELTAQLQIDKQELLKWLDRLCSAGLLVFVARNRYLLPEAADQLLEYARSLAATKPDGQFSTADFRDCSGIGRNHSVAVLEYFDRAGLTREVGALRMLR
ncbi:selenocysteine-specific translation elongation factor [Halopseudomonas sp.]|uniref:selenocysteine-specific translation elongation factor n=1 Tax=Halopseudomonas sp. TaxID=2901191 RepID=UPI0035625C36